MLDQPQRRACTDLNQYAQLPGDIRSGGGARKDQMQRCLDVHAGGDAQDRADACQRGIQAHERFSARFRAVRIEIARGC